MTRLGGAQFRNQKMHGEVKEEVKKLREKSAQSIQKVNDDLVKEVKQVLEKSIKKQFEPALLLDITTMRRVFATQNAQMGSLNATS